jgi:hypothetical protein
MLEKNAGNFYVPLPTQVMQWGPRKLVFGSYVCTVLEKGAGNLHVPCL